MQLARTQEEKLKKLTTKLFDDSWGTLILANMQIADLRREHKWYHWNLYRMVELKRKITLIQVLSAEGINKTLQDIREEKERSRQFLYNELDRLNDTSNCNLVEQNLNKLMPGLEKVIIATARLFLWQVFFGSLSFIAAIAKIKAAFSGPPALSESKVAFVGITSLGIAAVCVTINEKYFQTKLLEINKELADYISDLEHQKTVQSQQLSSCFHAFIQNLRPHNLE